jgi:hypothetical protein
MYAKLVNGTGAGLPAFFAMRDIARLLTSENPSTSLLQAFSRTSSVIVDPTPAGWSFVGSNSPADAAGINAGNVTTGMVNDVQYNLALSAPCLGDSAMLKYAVMTLAWLGTTSSPTNNSFALTAAESVNGAGVCVNEGPRYWTSAAGTPGWPHNQSIRTGTSDVLHVIANERHITIITENRGLSAVWETSMTDVHRFYNEAPVVQFSHSVSSILTRDTIIVPTQRTTAATNAMLSAGIAMTNVNTGAFSGTVEPTLSGAFNMGGNWFQLNPTTQRPNTISPSGAPRYQLSPIWLHFGWMGYPVQYVSGIVPAYWTAPQIGTTGDEMVIGGDPYTFFNAGTGVGIVLKTG